MANQLSLKLLVDTNSEKVLFAEAGKDVVDFLFNLLAMPIGAVVKLLTKEGMVGCIGNLYKSMECLDDAYIQDFESKASLLNPTVASPSLAKNTLFLAASSSSVFSAAAGPFSFDRGVARAVTPVGSGLVKGVVTYTVMDDLFVMPMSTISTIVLLNKFHVKDVGSLEERMVNLGMKEGLEILKASLQSKTVLSDVFLGKKASARK